MSKRLIHGAKNDHCRLPPGLQDTTTLSETHKTSYRQILKSSVLIGGSTGINVCLGIVRTKVLAVLIGTEGIGLIGAFNSVTTFVGAVAGMGIKTSGVRQIAEAVGTNDQQRIARTARVLRRTSLLLGISGMLLLLFFSRPIAQATFGNQVHAEALILLSVIILFTAVTDGQMALIQGLRRISDLAALSVLGAVLGTVCSIPIIFLFREKGIVPFLVTVAGLGVASSWWYARKIKLDKVPLPIPAVFAEVKGLLGIGVVFMSGSLVASATAYLIRVMVIREMGLEEAGLYQAAWTLSSVYVGFVLGAMGADYYPRLTAAAGNNGEVNRLVNEQMGSALLMAVPGILGTLTFAPWVLHLFYSVQFEPAVDILRWQILGLLGRIISWPLGFVLLAKGRMLLWFWAELAANFSHLVMVWLGMRLYGLSGLGMAFFGTYIIYVPLVLYIVRVQTGFRWTGGNFRLALAALVLTALVFLITGSSLQVVWRTIIGGMIAAMAGFYAFQELIKRAGFSSSREVWSGLLARIAAKKQSPLELP